MKRCFLQSRIPTPQPQHHRGLKTSPRVIARRPAVKQPRNTELLEIILQDKQDTISPINVQTNTHNLDSQDYDVFPQTAPPFPTPISPLPQSPLTDHNLEAARLRHKTVKPLPSGIRSSFQSKLEKNSFGIHALICRTRCWANRHCSHRISDSTTTMHLDWSPTAKLLPDPIWCCDTSKNWGTMAPSKAPDSSSV